MKTWIKPTLITIDMNAEIGGYQADEERSDDPVPRDGDLTGEEREPTASARETVAPRAALGTRP
jgi:hypothetical protein